MIEKHLSHAAGVARLLRQIGHPVEKAQANEDGALLLTSQPLPQNLLAHCGPIEQRGAYTGATLFGARVVWPTEEQHND